MPLLTTERATDQLLTIEYAGGPVEIAATIRPGGGDLLLCLHGLGCAKESFDTAYDRDDLPDFTICAFDFPGHGGSGPLPDAGYSIQAYADLTVGLVRQLAPDRVFLLCHSMGCAVGLVASQELAGLVGGFVSIEGNLVGQDCGLVSRGTAELPLAEFVDTSYPAFLTSLAGSPHADHRAWAGWYAQADPVAVHRAAASLVEWSDSGKLLDLFTSQPRPAYVHGGDSDDLGYLLPLLRGVRVYSIPRSRHFPMVDNPPAFWDAVTDAITVAA